jgi:hypothetical protein
VRFGPIPVEPWDRKHRTAALGLRQVWTGSVPQDSHACASAAADSLAAASVSLSATRASFSVVRDSCATVSASAAPPLGFFGGSEGLFGLGQFGQRLFRCCRYLGADRLKRFLHKLLLCLSVFRQPANRGGAMAASIPARSSCGFSIGKASCRGSVLARSGR